MMANGDAAAAVGLDLVADTDPLPMGFDEINKTRDMVANSPYKPVPVAMGGTGATSAAQARSNLAVIHTAQAQITPAAGLIPKWDGNRILASDGVPVFVNHVANKAYVDSRTKLVADQLPEILSELRALRAEVAALRRRDS